MNMVKIRNIAYSFGINHERLLKAELIKKIQAAEGNFECYATAIHGICDQVNCLWRTDCFEAVPIRTETQEGEQS